MQDWWARIICRWLHGGGDISRDEQGRINWRCRKCGRWSDNPVPLDEERRTVDNAIAKDAAKIYK
jgi:hypothetical protein